MFVNPIEPFLIKDKLKYQKFEVPIFDDDLPDLELRSFDLESALLVEASGGLSPCINNRLCRGVLDYQLITNLKRPIVLAASMSLQALYNYTSIKDPYLAVRSLAEQTTDMIQHKEACVLCHRYNQVHAVIENRKETLMLHKRSLIDRIKHDLILERIKPIQTYVCPIDVGNGYRSQWTLKPQLHDPYFFPIVDCPMSVLRARLYKGFYIVEQSALSYELPPLSIPNPGELVNHFVERVSTTDGYDYSRYALLNKSKLVYTLSFNNLQSSPSENWMKWSFNQNQLPVIQTNKQVNHQQLKHVVNHPELASSDYYLNACRLYDSYTNDPKVSDLGLIVTSSTFLPQWVNTVNNLSYWISLSRENNSILHQLSKGALKQRCQTRNSKDMIIKRMVSRTLTKDNVFAYDSNLFIMCKDLLLCTLLGNYKDRPKYLNSDQRHSLIKFFDDGKSRRWIMNLFIQCPFILNVCIRDFVGDQWLHRPSLYDNIKDIILPKEYIEFNNHIIYQVQKLIFEYSKTEWESLPSSTCSWSRLWMCGHKNCSIPCKHTLMLPNKLRRLHKKKQNMEDMLNQMFDLIEPEVDENASWVRPNEYTNTNQDQKDEDEADWKWEKTSLHKQLNSIKLTDKNSYRRPYLQSRDIFRSSQKVKIKKLDLSKYELNHIDSLLEITKDMVKNKDIDHLFQSFKKRNINLKNAKREWKKFDEETCDLISQIDWNIQQNNKKPKIISVSRQMAYKQYQTINDYHQKIANHSLKTAMGSKVDVVSDTNMVGALHYCVVYCHQCNTIKTTKDVRVHGLKDIKVSFIDCETCCATCDGHLSWYNLLGKVLVLVDTHYCLCTECGFLVTNPIMKDRLMCSKCSVPKKRNVGSVWKTLARRGECAVVHCSRNKNNSYTNKSSLTEASAHFIKDDVFVCTKHYHPKILEMLDSADIIKEINYLYRKRKLEQIES